MSVAVWEGVAYLQLGHRGSAHQVQGSHEPENAFLRPQQTRPRSGPGQVENVRQDDDNFQRRVRGNFQGKVYHLIKNKFGFWLIQI